MGRFYGKVGYAITAERGDTGIWEDQICERCYYGDVLRFFSKWNTSSDANDDLRIGNKISIMADAFAYENFSRIKYVEWMGVKWKVEMAEPERPRLVLTLGGEYNE